jgi:hypothetical protein
MSCLPPETVDAVADDDVRRPGRILCTVAMIGNLNGHDMEFQLAAAAIPDL